MEKRIRRCDGPGQWYTCQNRIVDGVACDLCGCRKYCSEGCREADAQIHSQWCHPSYHMRLRSVCRLTKDRGRGDISFNKFIVQWEDECPMLYSLNPFSNRSFSGNCLICKESLQEGGGRRGRFWFEGAWHHQVRCYDCRRKQPYNSLCEETLVDRYHCQQKRRKATLSIWTIFHRLSTTILPIDIINHIIILFHLLDPCDCPVRD